MKTPHKHAATIKAWADGATIQVKNLIHDMWYDFSPGETPAWIEEQAYRVKPEPKPDVVSERFCYHNGTTAHMCLGKANVRFTFDGETGKLKSAEVL